MTDTQGDSADQPDRPATADVALASVDEPSPPRPPLTGSEHIKLIGGLVVVCAGLLVLVAIAIVAMLLVDGSSNIVAVATSAFGVIGTVVGAYFGLKIGTDGTQTAVAGMRDEAAKAQAFAAHVPTESAAEAIGDAQTLAAGGSAPPGGPAAPRGDRPNR